jgi:hypothetical protein
MSYYDATESIYNKKRSYTRVQMMNRQWMHDGSGVKCEKGDDRAVPVFKLVVSEEIPTENYNYRYLTTVFLKRPDLAPFKMTFSSQEWCGSSFKLMRWGHMGCIVAAHSYFPQEGHKESLHQSDNVPFEAVYLLARQCVAANQKLIFNMLPSMRGNKLVEPKPDIAILEPAPQPTEITVPLGKFDAVRVTFSRGEDSGWLDVEAKAPYRLLRFSVDGITADLKHMERRAYWDRDKRSSFYAPNKAP